MTTRQAVLIAVAILVGAAGIGIAVVLKPSGFDRCLAVIKAGLEREATQSATTLDPRDTELSAARICAGQAG